MRSILKGGLALAVAALFQNPGITVAQLDATCTRWAAGGTTADRVREDAGTVLQTQVDARTNPSVSVARALREILEQQQEGYRITIACYVQQPDADFSVLLEPLVWQAMEPDVQRAVRSFLSSAR